MTDRRAAEVQLYRVQTGASRVHILTLASPQRPALDRFVLVERERDAALIVCDRCPLDVPLGRGAPQPVPAQSLTMFLFALRAASEAWSEDCIPEGAHDGITIIVERAEQDLYRRTRMVDPPENSAHARLLDAWKNAFPAVRRVLR